MYFRFSQQMKKIYHKVSWKDREKIQVETLDECIR